MCLKIDYKFARVLLIQKTPKTKISLEVIFKKQIVINFKVLFRVEAAQTKATSNRPYIKIQKKIQKNLQKKNTEFFF